ncbi:MAG: flagellar hook-basal body complex protein FliE [Melioribacteraceae bacterium]|jgi:flagellar hook-basal body complex protein FliE|nr:flagellar hook-basal body complex protein FliE [Ignavibacteriota bacterium]MBZ0182657.1 flagellar hook-basal body complex protein FliE [Melioribacteraceae bacterium]|tara:strand:- start:51 stop:338 length:288 start_codon:yes stop_codon:yes gene_type:complete
MKINSINGINPELQKLGEISKKQDASFGNLLGEFVKGVHQNQQESKQLTKDFVEGKDVELHEVMIAGEKAKTSLELLMEIRNKTIDMYKELTRMQ